MITRYRVELGGTQLDSIDDRIVILDVGYSPVVSRDKTFVIADMQGFDTSETYYERRTVTVTFQLRIYDTAERNAVCDLINEWASQKANLQINDKEEKFLQNVNCQQFASIESVRNWLDPLSLVFTTERNPFWLSEETKTVTITGKNNKGTLKMDGNIESALVSVTATATEPVSSIQFTVGDSVLKLLGLSVAVGQKIVVDYINDRYLRIRANGASVMNKLDKSSSDLLLAPCGKNVSVGVVANGKVTAVFSGRGMWR